LLDLRFEPSDAETRVVWPVRVAPPASTRRDQGIARRHSDTGDGELRRRARIRRRDPLLVERQPVSALVRVVDPHHVLAGIRSRHEAAGP
jgi:hypothetical protein